MSSYVVPENPIPVRYRTRSVSNLAYFVAPLEKNNTEIPIFADDAEANKENVEEFLAAVEVLQNRAVRKPWQAKLFRVLYCLVWLCIIYFVFVGQPLWDGVGLLFYRWINSDGIAKGGSALFMSWAAFQAFLPMLAVRFEQEVDDVEKRDASEVALVIPAYKAAQILPETIKHALKIFKPEQIFIIANGNSPTPLDDTAEVCSEFGVNVAWVPIGSKITAEFVGVALTSKYKYILLIDDDVHLPANLPIVTDRIQGNTKCIGYTIKSTGPNGSKGTLIQQCQDVEYKLSGLTRTFCGKYGSATFPHGAIILWERATLQSLFNVHPGYAISEDWFFGYSARASGCRIQFCSQVFVETETPPDLFFTSGPARGGFGEMTVFKQRFFRWNFFWSHRLWEDTIYMFFSWRLGWREIVTKLWVTVELYDCCMAFLRPWVIVLALIANWKLLLIFLAALTGMYAAAFILFNSWHLRKKNEMVAWKVMPVYMGMKFLLMWMNVASVYWDLWCYAKYFSVKHPRVIESRNVLEAAYKARLGPNLVPLDKHIGDAVKEAEEAAKAAEDEKQAEEAGPSEENEKVGEPVAKPPVGESILEAGQGLFGGFNERFTFGKKRSHTAEDERRESL
jgi:glycosyltransferase involved in cell wall biosynthesis